MLFSFPATFSYGVKESFKAKLHTEYHSADKEVLFCSTSIDANKCKEIFCEFAKVNLGLAFLITLYQTSHQQEHRFLNPCTKGLLNGIQWL